MTSFVVYVVKVKNGTPFVFSTLREAIRRASGNPVYRATLNLEDQPVKANGKPVKQAKEVARIWRGGPG
jgi:hypothetical protein